MVGAEGLEPPTLSL